ncbi:serine hydrolase-like protein isoform X3 [Myzus persicae]|uniref:serine hydrolase-like protein isoform X3 n=1 Tax=Myzus persicae TaxID=13164 RepID=UPI000B9357D1|nr:serine hydrolase-like protein isoform X3 [Myzus persicae]XP_022172401.1 serine hydrolase-like protein isoform X3 [Myzus persicae]
MNPQEISIPVPWGHIAAKTWGHCSDARVLCLHGIQDNSGTFDTLIPLLCRGFYYVCVDTPGHGRSSHFPPGFRITLECYALAFKRVVDYLKWDRFKCIGHSMGGAIASLFTSLYPEHVASLVMIDCAGPEPVHAQDTVKWLRIMCDGLLTIERKAKSGSPPSYTREQAVDALMTKRPSKLTRNSANVLVERSLVDRPDGRHAFSMDQRLKVSYNPMFTPIQYMAVVNSIRCPVLHLRATENPLQKTPENKLARKMYKSNPNVRLVKVNGNHDVHLNHPERIADLINTFLLTERNKI